MRAPIAGAFEILRCNSLKGSDSQSSQELGTFCKGQSLRCGT